MKSVFRSYKHLFLFGTLVLLFSTSPGVTVLAQHEGHTMPGMGTAASKPKPKTTAKRKSKRKIRRKAASQKAKVKKLSVTPTPTGHTHSLGMLMPTLEEPKAKQSSITPMPAGHTHTPGMVMPTPIPSPARAGASQMPSGQHDMHTAIPSPTPTLADSPGEIGTHDPSHPASHPASHPSPAAAKPAHDSAHDAMDHSEMGETRAVPSAQGSMPGMNMATTSAAGLMVMSGNDMGVRVGASETNVMPMGQMGSGTSWTPATTPMHMIHKQSGDWLLMLHYNAIVGVNSQGGPRGVSKFESANWIMPMAFRRVGKGTLQLRGMFSLEPFTFPPGGSPLLFQTGETYQGRPIIDAQHPHDLFMELSAQYTHALGERATWFAYFGYPGEPALGPVAFMHRASASENPAAALSHHLQDSSHISFGVLTSGFTYRWFKLEASVFNGREPDENRYNFEAHPWTSRSARLSFAPNGNWSMQVSHGLLRNPEAAEPGDVRRTTASISYNRRLDRGNWATSLIWGRNHESHSGEIFNLNGYVAESTVNFLDKNYLYTRLELVDKNALLRDADRLLLGISEHHPSFRIGAYTLGGVRDLWTSDKVSVGLGSDVTFYSMPSRLNPIYGDRPLSYRFFLRFRSGKTAMGGQGDAHQGMQH